MTENPFDEFDGSPRPETGGNAFDQFDSQASAASNPFDQFDDGVQKPAAAPAEPKEPPEDSYAALGGKIARRVVPFWKEVVAGQMQHLGENPNLAEMPVGMESGQEFEARNTKLADVRVAMADQVNKPGTLAHAGKELYQSAAADMKANNPQVAEGSLKSYAFMAVESLGQMAPGLLASVVSKSTIPTLAVMGGQVYGQQYGQARNESGRTPEEATRDAQFYALAETLPEEIPMGVLMKPGGKFLSKLLKTMGSEALTEMFTQVLEEGYDKGTINPDMTWGEAFRSVRDAGIVGAMVGGGMHVATHPFTREGEDQDGEAPVDPTVTTPAPRGAVADAVAQRIEPTAADIASPLPTESIVKGKQLIAEALGKSTASDILSKNGWPALNSRVTMDMGDGTGPQGGTVADAFSTTLEGLDAAAHGIRVQMDNGRSFEAFADEMQRAGVKISPEVLQGAAQLAPQVQAGSVAPVATPETPSISAPAPLGNAAKPIGSDEAVLPAPVASPPGELTGDGTRAAPIEVSHPEHLAAAEKAVNTAPTDAQKEAGNYAKGHIKLHGLDIAIENPKGSERSGTGPDGEPWSVKMPAAYGYVKRTTGADGEQVDAYIGPNPQSSKVFVIAQGDADSGKFDEHKAMLGFDTKEQALEAFHAAFSDGRGPDRMNGVEEMNTVQFKQKLARGTIYKPNGETSGEVENIDTPTPRDTSKDFAPTLPADLAGAKPRYAFGSKQFELKFDSDIDRAAYVTAQESPSKRDADFLKFAQDNSGMTAAEVRQHGEKVRAAIKAQAQNAKGNQLTVPEISRTEPAQEVDERGFRIRSQAERDEAITEAVMRAATGTQGAREKIRAAIERGVTDKELAVIARSAGWREMQGGSLMSHAATGYEARADKITVQFGGGEKVTMTPARWVPILRKAFDSIIDQDALAAHHGKRLADVFHGLMKGDQAATAGQEANLAWLKTPGVVEEGSVIPKKGMSGVTVTPFGDKVRAAFTAEMKKRPAEQDAKAKTSKPVEKVIVPAAPAAEGVEVRNLTGSKNLSKKMQDMVDEARAKAPKGSVIEASYDANKKPVVKVVGPEKAKAEPAKAESKPADDGEFKSRPELGPIWTFPDNDMSRFAILRSTADNRPFSLKDAIPTQARWLVAEGLGQADKKGVVTLTQKGEDMLAKLRAKNDAFELPGQQRPSSKPSNVKERKVIGKNARGIEVSEDQNGVRSYVDDGVRITEPVGFKPGGGISINLSERRDDFQTVEESAAAEPAPTPEPAKETRAADYGSKNRIYRKEDADKARAILRDKLRNQMSAGLDPELVSAGITLAGFHIEAGARKFSDFVKEMTADLGDAVKPYLAGWYMAVQMNPDISAAGMDDHATVVAAASEFGKAEQRNSGNNRNAADAAPAAEKPDVAEAIRKDLAEGKSFGSIREARARASEVLGESVEPGKPGAKVAEEAVELGVVLAARDEVAKGGKVEAIYDRLVDLYSRQPNLGTRTSTSIEQQAYSTPVPLAFLADTLAKMTGSTTVYEPTAGNGALLLKAAPKNIIANELNGERAARLRASLPGARIVSYDASSNSPPARSVDVVIANPPFGVVKGEDGENRVFQVDDRYSTREIDHAIAIKALEVMKDDGRAVLIVGGLNKLLKTEEARSDAYNGKAKREFYLTLYGAYNVVDHFTVAGELYAKQGAGWPVDVIVIDGRGKSSLRVPAADVPRIYNSWEQLKEVLSADRGRTAAGVGEADRGNSVPAAEPARSDEGAGNGSGVGRAGERSNPFGVRQPGGVRPVSLDRESGSRQLAESAPGEREEPAANKRAGGPRGRTGFVDQAAPSQVAYEPHSTATGLKTLVPYNMRDAIQGALQTLSDRLADDGETIDSYVAAKLGYKNTKELAKNLSAEQVDAVALAIDNMDKGAGFILGDQTGVGKGRVVASVIRYAIKSGRPPIFVTEKPNLYADMYRDLTDTGIKELLGRDVKILMTNTGESIPLSDDGSVKLISGTKAKHDALLMRAGKEPNLAGHDVVFTTYNQMQTVKGQPTLRMQFLEHIAPGSIIVFDESHNAGGNAATGIGGSKPELSEETRASFARKIAALAHGVTFSSATYAKRPDVMDLYASTDMRLAVADVTKLAEAISKGGVPMQQVVANMLARAGQYIRREKSFDGIAYNTPSVKVDRETYDRFASILAAVQRFSEDHVKPATKNISKELKAEGKSLGHDGATGMAGAASTNFSAIMHNLVEQMLLSIKAVPAAEQAIDLIKKGERPVITVANTMESFLKDFAEMEGAKVGDRIDLDFSSLLSRYLERSRTITLKKPWSKDPAVRHYMTNEELGPRGVAAYEASQKLIRDTDLSKLPVSPIDMIRAKIREAGFKVSEITGRGLTMDYAPDGSATLGQRSDADRSTAGKRKAIKGFNDGTIDAIIINQSGATGLSLHASEKFKDKRKRAMIIAQAERNIDTHMQMLGRVNRTGQVVLPDYHQLVADVPAEKRPAAVLAKKMASLNATTTATRSSAVTAKDVPDFMNEYGDQVAVRAMNDMPELHDRLDRPLKGDEGGLEIDGAMRRLTGRIPLLPIKEQEELYSLLEAEYASLLAQKDAAGENALEAKTVDLDAKTLSSSQVIAPVGNTDSPFADGVRLEQVDVKRIGKPLPGREVIGRAADALDMERPDTEGRKLSDALAEVQAAGRNAMNETRMKGINDFKAYRSAMVDDMEPGETRDKLTARLTALAARWSRLIQAMPVGATVKLMQEDGNLYGVVIAIKNSGEARNPLALGTWKATFALADASQTMTLPLSQLDYGPDAGKEHIQVAEASRLMDAPIIDAFDNMQSESREKRQMVTGNLLAGFDHVRGRGAITNYTDHEGIVRQGILLPRGYDYEKQQEAEPVQFRGADQVLAFLNLGKVVEEKLEGVTLARIGASLRITTPTSKSTAGRYYLNAAVRKAIGGDFVSISGSMRAEVPISDATPVIEALQRAGAVFQSKVDDRAAALSLMADPLQNPAMPKRNSSGPSLVQTATAAFKRWFGESKITTPDGAPKVVYHATQADFEAFSKKMRGTRTQVPDAKRGFFFTDSTKAADAMLGSYDLPEGRKDADGNNVMPVYLKMENPAEWDWFGRASEGEHIIEAIRDARKEGHDGVVIHNIRDGVFGKPRTMSNHYIVFEPEQVKSAIGNNGAFNPKDKRINFAKDGEFEVGDLTVVENTRFTEAKAEKVWRDLRNRLNEYGLTDVDLAVPRKIKDTDAGLFGPKVYGFQWQKIIMVALNDSASGRTATLDHEVIHAMRFLNLFKRSEWSILEDRAKRVWRQRYNIDLRYAGETEEVKNEEAIAEAHAEWQANARGEVGIIARLFQKMRDFVSAVRSAFRGEGFKAPRDVFGNDARAIFQKIKNREIGRRTRGEGVDSDPRFNRSGPAPKKADKAVEFSNPEVEKRFTVAKGGVGKQTLAERAKEWGDYVKRGFTRHFINLPNTAEYSDLNQQLRKLEAAPEFATDEIVRTLREMTGDMDRADLDLFSRKVILDDLSWEASRNRDLPFGLHADDIPTELAKVNEALDKKPELLEKVRKRKLMVSKIAGQLVEAGVLLPEQVKNPAYYRHQVLAYAQAMERKAAEGEISAPRWASRINNKADINANLLEAEFDWLRKALIDIKTAETIQWIKDSKHNVREDVLQEARDSNQRQVEQILDDELQAGGPTPLNDQWDDYKKTIAMAFSKVRDAIQSGNLKIPPYLKDAADALVNRSSANENEGVAPPFEFLTWMLDNNTPGSMGAAMAFKAIAGRKAFVKQMLGRKFADTADIDGLLRRGFGPKDHVTWQPTKGKHMFTAKTLPEHVMDAYLLQMTQADDATVASMLGLTDPAAAKDLIKGFSDTIRSAASEALMVGSSRFQLVVPKEVADTLDSFHGPQEDDPISKVFTVPMKYWKIWTLVSPRRVLKYNLNNLSGDIDAVIAGNPRVVKRLPEAIRELYAVMRGGKPSERYREALARGVFSSGLTIQEVPDINRLEQFKHLLDPESEAPVQRWALNPIGKVWRVLKDYTQFRENWLRYAAYLDYADRIEAGEGMKSIGYGGSLPAIVDAVADPKDRAAMLARDLLGDYGNVSAAGQSIRRSLIPFYSWMEVNTKRYWRFTSNAFGQGIGKGLATGGYIGASVGARTTAYLALRMFAMYGLVQMFNYLFHGDDQDRLDPEEQAQMHVIVGHTPDGRVITLRTQGALSDALSWLGFEDVVASLAQIENGRASWGDVLGSVATAPVKKVTGSITPIISEPVTLLTGRKFWPDPLHPRAVRDKWRELFSAFALENEYDLASGGPSRGYGASLMNALVYSADPGEQAYNRVVGLAHEWQAKEKGTAGSSDISSPRSVALYQWRKALRYGDMEAAHAALERTKELGVKPADRRRSLKAMHPLGNLSLHNGDRARFMKTLSPHERALLDEALGWYSETFVAGAKTSAMEPAE